MKGLETLPRIEIRSRAQWRSWLATNHASSGSIWLVTYKKAAGPDHVPNADVVEEALCFGWIDSRPAKLDEQRSMLLLSPRKPGSPWSKLNKQRIARLIKAGLMTPAGQAAIDRAKADGSWSIYDEAETLQDPPDLTAALAKSTKARAAWQAFSPSSRRGILWWIISAKRAETRAKRIAETARLAALGIRANHPEARGK
jgi:uncharacterized protein YdeI (YjbR/CyaY-like superfamily)